MMLELLSVTIGQRIRSVSLTVNDGQLVTLTGPSGSGKTTLLRAILGLAPVDEGYISIDGELVTPDSAPFFRTSIAYVPQDLQVPPFCNDKDFSHWEELSPDDRYIFLLNRAICSGKPLLIIDEPRHELSETAMSRVTSMLTEASQKGSTILVVSHHLNYNIVQL